MLYALFIVLGLWGLSTHLARIEREQEAKIAARKAAREADKTQYRGKWIWEK